MIDIDTTVPVLPSLADPSFRTQMHAYWLRQADLLRQDGNESLALTCERNAVSWSASNVPIDLEAADVA